MTTPTTKDMRNICPECGHKDKSVPCSTCNPVGQIPDPKATKPDTAPPVCYCCAFPNHCNQCHYIHEELFDPSTEKPTDTYNGAQVGQYGSSTDSFAHPQTTDIGEAVRKAMMGGWLKSQTARASTNLNPVTVLEVEDAVVAEIEALIQQQCTQARIDEVDSIIDSLGPLMNKNLVRWLRKRIKTLKGETK